MRRILAALFLILLASGLVAVVTRSPEAQTHTFPALDTNNTFTGTDLFLGQLQCKDLEAVKCVDSANSQAWAGADVGAWLNAAYTALPSTGGMIYLANLGTSCMNYSTPIVFATSGKYLILNGFQPGTSNNANPGGACLNYTPTTATDAITVDWTPLAGGGIKSGSGINNITLLNNSCATIGGCASSARGIHFATTGGGAENGLFQGVTVQGFGTGLYDVNAASISYGMTFTNLSVVYNTTGVNLIGYESLHFIGLYAQSNGTGVSLASGETDFIGGAIESNTTANLTYTGAVGLGRFVVDAVHFENLGNTTANYISGNMNLVINGGTMLDDFTAGANLNWLIQVGGNHVNISGLLVSTTRTLGITSILNVPGPGATRGITNFMINSPTLITNRVNGGNAKAISDFSTQPNTANPYTWNVEGCLGIGGTTGLLNTPVNVCAPATGGSSFTNNLQGVNDTFVYKATVDSLTNKTIGDKLAFTETTAPSGAGGSDILWGDSVDHMLHFNANNGGNQQFNISAFVTSAYTNATTTFSTVTNMSFPVAASRNYAMSCHLYLQGSATTAGPKFQLTGPASPTAVLLAAGPFDPIGKTTTNVASGFSTANTALGTIGALGVNYDVLVTAGIVNGVNAGTVVLQAAANGAGTLTIQPGSWCEFK